MDVPSRLKVGFDAVRHDLPITPAAPGSDSEHLAAAIEWLCRSQDVTDSGGSAASYNLVLGWDSAYPETTGYIIPTLYSYAATMDEPTVAERATRMADWLCTIQQPAGSFPGGTDTDGEPNVFNTGQIVFGLVSAYRETGTERYRAAAREACDWLVDQQTAEGYWDTYDYKGEVHAYTTRVAWALLEGATILPERREQYREAARRNLYWAAGLQRPNGWFEKANFERGNTPYLHTIAYTVRGLLEGGIRLEDDELTNAAMRTADKLLSIQQADGPLKGAYDESWLPSWYHCLTGNAQMALVWLRLFEHTGERRYLLGARQAIEFLKRRQVRGQSAQIDGALAGSYPIVGSYIYLRYPNWSAKFFADALLLSMALDTSDGDQREQAASTRQSRQEPKVRKGTDGGQSTATVAERTGNGQHAGRQAETAVSADQSQRTGQAPQTSTGTDRSDADSTEESEQCRICLLCDGETVNHWVADAITNAVERTDAEISLVVINEEAGLTGPENVKRGRKYPAYAAYWLGSQLVDTVRSDREDKESVHIDDLPGGDDAERIRTYPTEVDGLWNELPAGVIEEIDSQADLVFRRGFGLITGDVLSATEYGVLSYHHGDPRAYRGGPAGFWEYVNGEETVGMMVQKLTEELDGGTVLAYDEVDISQCDRWGEVRATLYDSSTELLADAIENVQSEGTDKLGDAEMGPVYNPPSAVELGEYLWKRYVGNRS